MVFYNAFIDIILNSLLIGLALYAAFIFYGINYKILNEEGEIKGKFSVKVFIKIFISPIIISLIFTVYIFYFPIIDEQTGENIRQVNENDPAIYTFFVFSFIAGLVGSIKGFSDGLNYFKQIHWRDEILKDLAIALENNDFESIDKTIYQAINQIIKKWFSESFRQILQNRYFKSKTEDKLYIAFIKGWEESEKKDIHLAEKEVVKSALDVLTEHYKLSEKIGLPFIPSR